MKYSFPGSNPLLTLVPTTLFLPHPPQEGKQKLPCGAKWGIDLGTRMGHWTPHTYWFPGRTAPEWIGLRTRRFEVPEFVRRTRLFWTGRHTSRSADDLGLEQGLEWLIFVAFGLTMANRAMLLYLLLLALPGLVHFSSSTATESQKSRPGIASEDCHLFPWLRGIFDFKCFRFVSEILRTILWISKATANIFRSIVTTVLETCLEIVSNVFTGVKQIIKFVEFVGYCVRLLLRANYNFVSYLLTSLQELLEMLVEGLRKLFEGVLSVLVTFFQSIIRLLHDIVMSIPTAFELGLRGMKSTKEVASAVLHSSYVGWKYILTVPGSTLLSVITTTRAVLECLFISILNTIGLVAELMLNSILHALQFMTDLFVALYLTLFTAGESTVHGLRYLSHGIGSLVATTGQLVLTLIETVMEGSIFLVRATFGQIHQLFISCGWLIVTAVAYVWSGICLFHTTVLGLLQRCSQGLVLLVKTSIHYTPGGGWTLTSVISASLAIIGWYLAFGVNPMTYIFEMIERLLLSATVVLSLRPRSPVPDEASVREQRLPRATNKKTDDLRAELDQERDRHLCVVCQDQPKNMIVMPCRHLCLCAGCSRELLRVRQWRGSMCPLCRGRITKILEVYI